MQDKGGVEKQIVGEKQMSRDPGDAEAVTDCWLDWLAGRLWRRVQTDQAS